MRGRGLKHGRAFKAYNHKIVAPHAGAWIETALRALHFAIITVSPPMRGRGLKQIDRLFSGKMITSPPMRGRGLKPHSTFEIMEDNESPPMRGRGLKLSMLLRIILMLLVAPHAGAWIETGKSTLRHFMTRRRPPCGGVD